MMKPKIRKPIYRINVKIRLPNVSGREYLKNPYGDITFRKLSVHTTMHEILNKVKDKMNVDVFTSILKVYKRYQDRPLNI